MPSCIFLFPNSLIPSGTADRDAFPCVPEALRNLMLGAEEPSCASIFSNEELDGYAAAQWIWMKITSRGTLLPAAPYLWKGQGGYQISHQFWHMAPYVKRNGVLEEAELALDEDEECLLRDLLTPLLRRYKLDFQLTSQGLFATRRIPWNVISSPWQAQKGKAPFEPEGEDAESMKEMTAAVEEAFRDSEVNEYRRSKGLEPIDGLWTSGGGHEERILPPTQIRALQTTNALYRGIADASGLIIDMMTGPQDKWPDCPPGDRIVVFDAIGEARDAETRNKLWQEASERITALVDKLETTETYEIIFVATDGKRISTLVKKDKMPSLAFWKKKNDFIDAWLCPNP